LVEVVIAIGVFAIGITAAIALTASMMRTIDRDSEARIAANLAGAVQAQLEMAAASSDFESLVAQIPVMDDGMDNGFLLVAARDGTQVRLLQGSESAVQDQFFLIEVRAFAASPPLGKSSDAEHLATNVRISWPYRPLGPDGLVPPIDPAKRDIVSFNLAINR